jgi:hypothetical protein
MEELKEKKINEVLDNSETLTKEQIEEYFKKVSDLEIFLTLDSPFIASIIESDYRGVPKERKSKLRQPKKEDDYNTAEILNKDIVNSALASLKQQEPELDDTSVSEDLTEEESISNPETIEIDDFEILTKENANNFYEEVEEDIIKEKPKKTKIPKKEIETKKEVKDLSKINIISIPAHSLSANFENQLKKTVRSTFQVILPQSGIELQVRGLGIDELDALKNSFTDEFSLQQKLVQILYSCTEETNVGYLTFEEFKSHISHNEIDLILFGVFNKTYGKMTSYRITCPECKEPSISKRRENKFSSLVGV